MCKSSQSANLSTRFFEECIQPSLHHLSALQRRFPETHSKPHSLSKHQFCFGDGFIEKVGFELVLKAEQIQIAKEVEFRKEYYRWNDDHGQSAEMQNKGCLDDSEVLQGILILFKKTFRKRTFPSSRAFYFSKCLGALSSTYSPKFKNKSKGKHFLHP